MLAVESFGGKCQICQYDKCIDALEFHHVNQKEKEEKPSYVIMRWSWERAKKELEKCILVCSNCHKEIHHKTLDVSLKTKDDFIERLNKFIKPWLDKKCEYCNKQFSTKCEIQKFCSVSCSSLNQRHVTRPSKEELKNLIDNKTTWLQMGRMFNVSDNAVRKWARNYDLLGSKL